MTLTVTLHAWYLAAYLSAGAVLYLPLNLLAWKHTASPKRGYWTMLTMGEFDGWTTRHRVWRFTCATVAQIVLWPLAIWDEVR